MLLVARAALERSLSEVDTQGHCDVSVELEAGVYGKFDGVGGHGGEKGGNNSEG